MAGADGENAGAAEENEGNAAKEQALNKSRYCVAVLLK
jgi:hypothetical protein